MIDCGPTGPGHPPQPGPRPPWLWPTGGSMHIRHLAEWLDGNRPYHDAVPRDARLATGWAWHQAGIYFTRRSPGAGVFVVGRWAVGTLRI